MIQKINKAANALLRGAEVEGFTLHALVEQHERVIRRSAYTADFNYYLAETPSITMKKFEDLAAQHGQSLVSQFQSELSSEQLGRATLERIIPLHIQL